MSKSGMNWLLTVAVAVAAGAIGAGAYYLNKDETAIITKAEKIIEKLQAAANGNVQLSGPGARQDQVETTDTSQVPANLDIANEVADNIPSFDVMRVEPSGDAVVAGRAEAGSIVALISNGDVIGKGIANNRGEFAIVLEKPLKPGDHDVSLEATSKTTQEKMSSVQHIAVSVPETERGEVLVVLNEPNAPSKVLQLPKEPVKAEPVTTIKVTEKPATPTTDNTASVSQEKMGAVETALPAKETGTRLAKASVEPESQGEKPEPGADKFAKVQTPSQESASASPEDTVDTKLAVKAVETEQGKVFVSGESEPGAQVRVYVDEELIGAVKAGKEGHWLIEAEKDIPAGNVEVRADNVEDTDGKVKARAQVVFTEGENDVAMIPVRLVAESSGSRGTSATVGVGDLPSVIIRQGDNLWTISRRLYGKGIRYTTIYQANSQQIRNPDLIYPGQVFMLPVADLNWKSVNN